MKIWKKSLLMLTAIIVLVIGTVAVYGLTVLNSTTTSLKTTRVNYGNNDTIKASKPLTILLMGIDTRGGSSSWDGNTDSQIVMTLNPKTDTTTMLSMERDTPTSIVNSQGNVVGSVQKMNAAFPLGYNNGGLQGAVGYAMNTIGQQAGIPIDNFVIMNFDGLVNLVNDVGGVDVVNDSGSTITIANTEPEYTATVPYIVGNPEQLINGEQALVFARDRDTLPNGDYGRAAHQREVLQALMKKMMSMDNISQYQKFLTDISQDFKTNISVDTGSLPSLLAYKDCFKKVVSISYQGIGETWQGASYQFMPQEVDLAVQNMMRQSLGLSAETTLNSNIITFETEFGSASLPNYFMPSATVSQNGKSTTYGIKTDGSLVTIDDSNSSTYVSSTGSAVTAPTPSSSSTSSSSSSSAD